MAVIIMMGAMIISCRTAEHFTRLEDARQLRCYDLFCGGGGSSRGAAMAGVHVLGGLDRDEFATKTFKLNFPDATVSNENALDVDPAVVHSLTGEVDILLASPECTSHSVAKGNAPRCEASRETAFQVIRFAKVLKPRWIIVENVPRMQLWPRFDEWVSEMQALGYKTNKDVLNAQDYRTPQSRKRLFVICDREATPTFPQRSSGRKATAKSILTIGPSKGKQWPFRHLRKGVHADATLERANRAFEALGHDAEFIMVYYGSDGAGGFQQMERPLRTVTTLDRFAYVRPNNHGHEIRMLQPVELAAAMGFPATHLWPVSSRRDKIRLIGNAVCPPVMAAIIRHLTGSRTA
jgi:DNA (cytosine-5)-methyltransferase 1